MTVGYIRMMCSIRQLFLLYIYYFFSYCSVGRYSGQSGCYVITSGRLADVRGIKRNEMSRTVTTERRIGQLVKAALSHVQHPQLFHRRVDRPANLDVRTRT